MPFIKYYGGRTPIGIKEHITYADRQASCRDGLPELLAKAREYAEAKFSDPDDIASSVRQYIDDNKYPGLDHIGGIGLIDTRKLCSNEEEISETEFKELRDTINRTNEEYIQRLAKELKQNNDPLRRASPEDEALGWRTRVCILSHTELKHHVAYSIVDNVRFYLRVRELQPSGLTAQLIDIYHSASDGIEEAVIEGGDWSEVLADLLAVIGFGRATIVNNFGTTVPYAKAGDTFELANFGADTFNSPVPIIPNDFKNISLGATGRLMLRHLRDGLSHLMPSRAFPALWNALERKAAALAKQRGDKRTAKCSKCGSSVQCKKCKCEINLGPDLKKGFLEMYAEAGLNEEQFKEHRNRRGHLQHGSKMPTISYQEETFKELVKLQPAAVIATSKEINISPVTTLFIRTSLPVTVFQCAVDSSGKVSIQTKVTKIPFQVSSLPQRICGSEGRTIQTGVPWNQVVDNLALPPIEK